MLARVLVALFLCYYASSTFFVHTHNIDGHVFTHSHPYSSSSHSHTTASLQLFGSLNHILFVIAASSAAGIATLNPTKFHFSEVVAKKYNPEQYKYLLLRGPPAYC